MNGLPLFELVIDESAEAGVKAVALVDNPAIEVDWVAFNEADKNKFNFITESEEKRIVFGALMIPDLQIYRRNQDGYEFNVVFSKDTIYQIRERFMREKRTAETNAQHIASIAFDDVYMVETFIKDSQRGVMPPEQFQDLPDGTWFGAFKVDNDQVWNDFVKTGLFKGFSVEGNFKQILITENMNLVEKMDELFAKYFGKDMDEKTEEKEQYFIDATLMDGTAIKVEPALEEGAVVMVITPDGDVPAPDATHELSDGTLVTTVSGMITEIKAKIEEEEPTEEMETKLNTLLDDMRSELSAKFEAQRIEFEAIKEKNIELEAFNKELLEAVRAFESAPKEEPTSTPKSAVEKETAKDRAVRMAQILHSNKIIKL